MATVYFDNFRGFQSTFLSLKDVNFLVGENSTGKTSVLKLIGILASGEFWRYLEFGNEETTSLGAFSEIITVPRDDREYFDIGIINDAFEELTFIAIKLRFIERDEKPWLKEIRILDDAINLQVSVEESFLKFRYTLHDQPITNKETSIENRFINWIHEDTLAKIKFNTTQKEYNGLLSILAELQFLINQELRINGKKILFSFKLPTLIENMTWMAPIRLEPKKLYDASNLRVDAKGTHSPHILNKFLRTDESAKIIFKKFGLDSGLYEDIDINELQDETKKTKPFQIVLSLHGKLLNIINVGFGVSQVLPLVAEVIFNQNKKWFAFQQPEVHLHPRAQAAFGEFVYKSNRMDKCKFIIETHSDYLIDRFRLRLKWEYDNAKDVQNRSTSQVLFFMKTEQGNSIIPIEIHANGNYSDKQPKEFREFFFNEQLSLLEI